MKKTFWALLLVTLITSLGVATTTQAFMGSSGFRSYTPQNIVNGFNAALKNNRIHNAAAVASATPSTFSLGDRVKTTAKLNVRSLPTTRSYLLGSERLGSLGTIVAGPTIASGYVWWKVNYDNGITGWSIENYLVFVTPAQTATPTIVPTRNFSISSQPVNTVSRTFTITGLAGSLWVNVAGFDQSYNKVCNDNTPINGSFTLTCDSSKLVNGSNTLTLIAFSTPAGTAGGTTTLSNLVVTVSNSVPTQIITPTSTPVVNIAPTRNFSISSQPVSTVSGTFTISGLAGSLWVNVAGFDQSYNKVCNDNTPINGSFTLTCDSSKLVNGSNTLTLIAFSTPAGTAGGTTTLSNLAVTVSNSVPTQIITPLITPTSTPVPALGTGTTYYVSPTGSDSATGKSTTAPWQSITKVNASVFNAGDTILFQGGQNFTGCLAFSPSNVPASSATNPVTLGSYGTGNFILTSNCSGPLSSALLITNINGFTVQNATISAGSSATQFGIWIYNTSSTVNTGITVKNSDISGFHYAGTDNYGSEIFVASLGGGLDTIQVLNNTLHGASGKLSTDDAGISGYGNGKNITNVLYKGNTIYDIGGKPNGPNGTEGNGIVANGINGGILENNLVYNSGANSNNCGGPAGVWTYNSNNITIQHNEVYGMGPATYTTGCDWDGFDMDGDVTNSVMQYNYAHNNWGTGFLAWIGGTWSGNTIRYNIAENNAMTVAASYFGQITIANSTPNAALSVYNNTLYSNAPAGAGALISVQGNPLNTIIANNSLYSNNGAYFANTGVDLAPSVTMVGNNYYSPTGTFTIRWSGYTSASDTGFYNSLASFQAATGQEKISGISVGTTLDPKLNSPGSGGTIGGYNPALPAGYQVQTSSPMLGTGLNLNTRYGTRVGPTNYYGTSIPTSVGTGFNIGAY